MVFPRLYSTKKQLLKFAFLTTSLLPLVTSCDEHDLDASPRTSVSEANAFDTPARVLAQVHGLYATIKSGSLLGGRYQVYNDIRGEEWINRTTNGVTGYTVWQHTNGADDSYTAAFWNSSYSAINRVNVFLKGLQDNASKVDPTLAQHYAAEAKFVRALAYFSMVQVFAKPYILDNGASPGLPLRLQAEMDSQNNLLPRSSVAEVYTQILSDLNDAETGLPDSYSSADLNVVRAHKNTAIALKTRVYLAMGRYADVITEGNKIVSATAPFTSPNRIQHALQADVTTPFKTYTTTESIFSVPMATTNAPGGQSAIGAYFNQGTREFYLNPAAPGILANTTQWRATDDRRTKFVTTISGGQYITKFSGVSPYLDWVPVIRYAEVLLNLAEAEAEVGSEARAIALLQAVHQRSDATWTYTGTSKSELINAILTERRIELIAEGFRTNDFMRRGLPIESVGAGASIQPTDPRYLLPIPTTETTINTDL